MDAKTVIRKRLEAATEAAWWRRNGTDIEDPDPFTTGMEFLAIEDNIEVYPLWSWTAENGRVRGWSNHPSATAAPDGWAWRDDNPPEASWIESHIDEEWMGEPEYHDWDEEVPTPKYVEWIVSGPHKQQPPIPDELIEYLAAVDSADVR